MTPECLRSNLHCHSRFSDGENSLEELVLAAIGRGFVSLGFSEHAYTPYDPDCSMAKEDLPRYFAEIARLREQYAGQIELYTGLEVDSHEPTSKAGLDFTIGSVHYLHDASSDAYYNVDYLPELFEKARDRICGGDIKEMAGLYYSLVQELAQSDRPDIIGHIDLIKKLNAGGAYFDESSSWYLDLVESAARSIAQTGCIVEVNTGGICRGYRQDPYPSREILRLLLDLGVPVTISSDAHTADDLDFWFPQARRLLLDVGFRSVKQLRRGAFVDIDL